VPPVIRIVELCNINTSYLYLKSQLKKIGR